MSAIDAANPNLHDTWDTEVCLFCADSRAHLVDELESWARYLDSPPEHVRLSDIAFTLARAYHSEGLCIAVVASSITELARKIVHARTRCADPHCRRIQDRSGIFWFEDPLGPTGKTAFMFPGEGSQYVGMLRELCFHFPEARSAFDVVDRACELAGADFVPSALVFPFEQKSRGASQDALWTMEAAVESVISANLACMQLFEGLAIHPDGVVGHSSGEFAALVQAGVVRLESREERTSSIADGYRLIKDLVAREDISDAVLLTVGGADSVAINNALAAYPGKLLIAMANCPHQFVLCAMPDIANEVHESLTKQGAVVSPLPFDRPYHTPWFEPALQGIAGHFQSYRMHPPRIELYSCAAADVCPNDVEKIRELGIVQWASTVRFQETIECMHHRGYRIFIEVGPRGNLAAFASDILKGYPHLSVAANRTHRSAITQLNHAVGMLAAHRIPMKPEYLHIHRASVSAGPAASAPTDTAPKGRTIRFSPSLPQIRLPTGAVRRGSPETSDVQQTREVVPQPQRRLEPEAVGSAGEHTVLHTRSTGVPPGLSAYFDTMQEFLSLQQDVTSQLLAAPPASAQQELPPAATAGHASVGMPPPFPLLGEITERDQNQSLVAVKTFHVNEESFLKDHTFGTNVSTLDSELTGLPVMPLTMTLELMAEAAVALLSGKVVVGLENIRATQWISFEDGERTLRIVARRLPADGDLRVRATVFDQDHRAQGPAALRSPVAEADVLLAGDYPENTELPAIRLRDVRRTDWTRHEIYPDRLFHGPQFQCIRSVSRWGVNGLEGTVESLPRNHLFRAVPSPRLCIDPVVLDGIGAMLGLWGAYETLTGAVFFPFRVDSIQIFGPPLAVGTELKVSLQVVGQSDMSITADIYAQDRSGQSYVRIQGWQDRAFDVRPSLHRVSHRPVDRLFSDSPEWDLSPSSPQLRDLVFCQSPQFPTHLFESSHQVWRKVLAFVLLSSEERAQYNAMPGSPERKLQWLFGRAVAKDAVRTYLLNRDGLQLAATDVVIRTDPSGKPHPDGAWAVDRNRVAVSISHSGELAVAVAGEMQDGGGLGIDVELHRDLNEDFLEGAFSRQDNRTFGSLLHHTPRWGLRLWCAKEALAKAVGVGMRFDPKDITISQVFPDTGQVELALQGNWLRTTRQPGNKPLIVHTADTHRFCVAVCRTI
jgi:malonyl CoA-acyl carrier protein transacylase/phosphopantetheinyl transferase